MGLDNSDSHVGRDPLGEPRHKFRIGQEIERRQIKLGAPAPTGFFMTFRNAEGTGTGAEMYLEQPQGNATLKKVDADKNAATASAYSGPLKDLLGSYRNEQSGGVVEITDSTLPEYVSAIRRCTGVLVARPLAG